MDKPRKRGERACVFGYGSLVNHRTWLDPLDTKPATVTGWIRQWRHRVPLSWGAACGLTIVPCAAAQVAGLVARLDEPWEALDSREIGYKRVPIAANLHVTNGACHADRRRMCNTYVYTSAKKNLVLANQNQPILQTYIDVIAEGYYNLYGPEGLDAFFSTTQGWHLPIVNDRRNPLYPRSLKFKPSFLKLVDEKVEQTRQSSRNI